MNTLQTLKFRVDSAELLRVKKGDNKGKPFVKMTIIEDDLFAEDNSKQTITLFIPEENVEQWEETIEKGTFPPVYGNYFHIPVPSYTAKNPRTGEMGTRVKSSIRVFCRFKGGQPVEDPKTKAERLYAQNIESGDFVHVGEEAE